MTVDFAFGCWVPTKSQSCVVRSKSFKLSTDPFFGEGARHRGLVFESPRQSSGAVRGREKPDPSPGAEAALHTADAILAYTDRNIYDEPVMTKESA